MALCCSQKKHWKAGHKKECGDFVGPVQAFVGTRWQAYRLQHGHLPGEVPYHGVLPLKVLAVQALRKIDHPAARATIVPAEVVVNTTACKRLFSLGCVAHTDGAVLQAAAAPGSSGGNAVAGAQASSS